MRYYATEIRKGRYAVRPFGRFGTCGWIDGQAWTVTYINARNASEAMLKFHVSYSNKKPIIGR